MAFSGEGTSRHCFRQAAPPPPDDGADHTREKQGTRMAYREHGKVPVPSPSCFVCLRGPSCPFVDNSFFVVSGKSRPRPPTTGRIIRERNRGPVWPIGSTERFRFPHRLASCVFVVLRAPSWITLFLLFQASRAPAPHDGADHTREKQGTRMAYREHGKVPVPSPSFFVALRRPSCPFVDNSFYPVACSAKPGCFTQAAATQK